jgi:prepilin-type processing-associated H-X9-DG protein
MDRFFPVDLRPYTNMGFKDEVANDGKGGWSDEGNNDLKYFPVGRQLFGGVLFDVIDPAVNNGKSCLQPFLVKERAIKGIKVNRKLETLFFLYGTTYTMCGKGEETAFYQVVYADGQAVKIPIRFGIEITDWYSAVPESETVVKAWEGDNGFHSPIYITRLEWRNPHPEKEISAIDVALPPVVPFRHGLIALTGLLPSRAAGQTFPMIPTGKVNNGRNIKMKAGEVSYMRDDPNFNMNDPRAEFQSANPIDLSTLRTLTFTAEFDEEGWINLIFILADGKTIVATFPKQIKAQKGSSEYSVDLTTLKWRLADTEIPAKLTGKIKTLWISTSQGTGATVRFRNVILHGMENTQAGNESDSDDPCARNMKRLGRAMLEYARDHKGRLPSRGPHVQYAQNGVPTNVFTNDPDLWSMQILKYLKLPNGDYSVFHCPAVQVNGKPLAPGDSAMTYAIVWQTQQGPNGGRMHGKFLGEFGDPSKHFLLIEPKGVGLGNVRNALGNCMYYWNISRENNASYLDSIDFRHNGKAHFLFVDGHVELLGPDEIVWPTKK